MKLNRSGSPNAGRLALFELSFNRVPRERSPYLQGKQNVNPKIRCKSKPVEDQTCALTKTTSSTRQKGSSKSNSSKKSTRQTKQTVRPLNRVWKLEQPTQNTKKLSLNISKERLKLPSNLEERSSIELRKFSRVLTQMLSTKDDQKFCTEFSIFKDISKQYQLGVFRQLVDKLSEAYERKYTQNENFHYQTQSKLQQQIAQYKIQVKKLTKNLLETQQQLSVALQRNRLIKMRQVEKKDQQTNTKSNQSTMEYMLRLEKKLKEFRQREYRFLKVLKILQSRGVDFSDVKDQLDEDNDSNISRTNLNLIRQPNLKKNKLLIVGDPEDIVADNSVVNDSDESSFDFAGKIPEPNFFECKRIYKNKKIMDPILQKNLKIDMDALYESEQEQHITTV